MEHGRAQVRRVEEQDEADRLARRLARAERVLAVLHRAAVTALALASLWLLLR